MDELGSDQERDTQDDVEELDFGEVALRRDTSMLLAGDDPISRVRLPRIGLRSFSELRPSTTERSLGRRMAFGSRR